MENVYVAMQTLKWITLPSLSWSPLNKNIEDNTYTCICYILNRLFVVLMMSIDKQKAVPLSLLTPPYQTRSVRWEGFIRGHSHPIEGKPVIHVFYTYWLHVLIHVHVFIQRSLFHAYIWFCMVRVLWSIITISTICNWKKNLWVHFHVFLILLCNCNLEFKMK